MLAMYDLLKQFLGKNLFLCIEIKQGLTGREIFLLSHLCNNILYILFNFTFKILFTNLSEF